MEELKVLVVDDEPGMRTGVERSLRGVTFALPAVEGEVRFDVRQAETGEDALDAIAADRPAKACVTDDARTCDACMKGRIERIGRTVGRGRGDSPQFRRRRPHATSTRSQPQ